MKLTHKTLQAMTDTSRELSVQLLEFSSMCSIARQQLRMVNQNTPDLSKCPPSMLAEAEHRIEMARIKWMSGLASEIQAKTTEINTQTKLFSEAIDMYATDVRSGEDDDEQS